MENQNKSGYDFSNDERFKPLAESITNASSAENALDWVAQRARDAGLNKDVAQRIINDNYSTGSPSSHR